MKSQKAVGHLSLILCVIIIALVVASIVYYTKDMMQKEQKQSYETDMLLVQGKIKILSQESTIKKSEELLKGRKLSENIEDEQIKKLLENNVISQDEENFSKYYILEKSNLEEIGLNGIELKDGYYIVNYATYEIIYSNGIDIKGNIYYKLSDLQKVEETEEKAENEQENNEQTNEQATK